MTGIIHRQVVHRRRQRSRQLVHCRFGRASYIEAFGRGCVLYRRKSHLVAVVFSTARIYFTVCGFFNSKKCSSMTINPFRQKRDTKRNQNERLYSSGRNLNFQNFFSCRQGGALRKFRESIDVISMCTPMPSSVPSTDQVDRVHHSSPVLQEIVFESVSTLMIVFSSR